MGISRLTGPQWHNQFKASKTLSLPYDYDVPTVGDVGILICGGWCPVLNKVSCAPPRSVDSKLVYR